MTSTFSITNGWRAVPLPPMPPDVIPFSPGTRCYQKDLREGHLTVIVGRDAGKWHLSISHRTTHVRGPTGKPLPGRLPTWEEIKEARELFTPNEVTMAILLPPREEWVNVHSTTMHLWQVESDPPRKQRPNLTCPPRRC